MTVFLFIIAGCIALFLILGLFISYRVPTDGTIKERMVSIFTSFGGDRIYKCTVHFNQRICH